MTDFPYTDEELVDLAKKYGKRDADITADDTTGFSDTEYEDLADDAWAHSGWANFENDPKLADHWDQEISDRLKLSSIYIDTFVEAIKHRDGVG
ncbi:MAG: hypothetical protein HKM24_04820 [Gammaproteobacteria bacterium]|nr:hypothetical protein [Gammaproteobacteria bacterium]